MRPTLDLHRWTVEDYDRMIESGVLGEDDRVELIEGEIVEMAPIGSPHSASVAALTRLLAHELSDRYLLWVQSSVRLPPRSQPQPDLAVLSWRDDYYRGALPEPADVVLVVEVADASLAADRARKLPLYGRVGILEAWLVDLVHDGVEVHRAPTGAGYSRHEVLRRGEIIESTAIEGLRVPVDTALAQPSTRP